MLQLRHEPGRKEPTDVRRGWAMRHWLDKFSCRFPSVQPRKVFSPHSCYCAIPIGVAARALAPFPTAIHHLYLGKADLGTDDRIHPSALGGTGEQNFRAMSQAEIFARRIHREGLPVARLWESKSALISLGLNTKGKPGLWLTQKVQ